MKVYVAGAWVEKKERAEVWIAKLRKEDIEITHDWTVDNVPSTITTDAQLPPGERLKRAKQDYEGVLCADVVWLLAPDERGASGAWTEFGMAIAERDNVNRYDRVHRYDRVPPLVVVSGVKGERSIFTSLADMVFAEQTTTAQQDHKAFEYLVALYNKGQGVYG